jgi:hypothetical protein
VRHFAARSNDNRHDAIQGVKNDDGLSFGRRNA